MFLLTVVTYYVRDTNTIVAPRREKTSVQGLTRTGLKSHRRKLLAETL